MMFVLGLVAIPAAVAAIAALAFGFDPVKLAARAALLAIIGIVGVMAFWTHQDYKAQAVEAEYALLMPWCRYDTVGLLDHDTAVEKSHKRTDCHDRK